MTTATVKARQTVYDIALEQYGTCEAVGEILVLNPQIETVFYLDVAVAPGTQLRIDDESGLMRKNTLKELENDITTYRYGEND